VGVMAPQYYRLRLKGIAYHKRPLYIIKRCFIFVF